MLCLSTIFLWITLSLSNLTTFSFQLSTCFPHYPLTLFWIKLSCHRLLLSKLSICFLIIHWIALSKNCQIWKWKMMKRNGCRPWIGWFQRQKIANHCRLTWRLKMFLEAIKEVGGSEEAKIKTRHFREAPEKKNKGWNSDIVHTWGGGDYPSSLLKTKFTRSQKHWEMDLKYRS